MNHYRAATKRLLLFFLAFIYPLTTDADFELGLKDDGDLTHFITRPEIKAPRFDVTIHDKERVTPGYWFIAPYAAINQEKQPNNYYQSCQTGPAIYDGSGELIWSGACLFKNQNACDFRPFRANGTDHLSLILYVWPKDPKGRGVLLDSAYEVTHSINVSKVERNMNMHEMQVLPEGRSVLYIIHKSNWIDTSELEEVGVTDEAGWVLDCGFREVEVDTGKVLFEWWALDHVKLLTSSVAVSGLEGPAPSGWNWFHMNSVDKSPEGDYLISSRYTDCIYKVSGKDGSVLWRLGGDESSFVLEGFNFSKQHDARFVEETDDLTVISFLDNASDGVNNMTSDASSGLLIALDTSGSPMVARVLRRWTRPDERVSHLRGNFQMLPNGNLFAGWSDNSYISEHTYDGDVVMTANFASQRFVTYRTWKHNFTGYPSEPPTLKLYAFGMSPASSTTVGYVSWNGATEVATWMVYRNSSSTAPLAHVGRDGFETMFQLDGFEESLYIEAVSAAGQVLGQSQPVWTTVPRNWVKYPTGTIGNDKGGHSSATLSAIAWPIGVTLLGVGATLSGVSKTLAESVLSAVDLKFWK